MPDQLIFAMEVMLNGLLNGVMYALVALGFVLIFKASGIFNYAQGVMALFAAMTLVGIQQGRVPFGHLINEIFGTDIHYFGWTVPAFAAIALTVLVMVGFAWLVQRFVFMPMFLFSGTFYPLTNLPIGLQWIGWISPLWHATELGRVVTYGAEVAPGMIAVHLIYLLALTAGGLVVARRLFARRLAA